MGILILDILMLLIWISMIADAFSGEVPDPTAPRTPPPAPHPDADLPIWKRKY